MSISAGIMRSGALLLCGAALGGGAGYAASASGASTTHAKGRTGGRSGSSSLPRRLRRAVSVTAVLPDAHGSFATVSIERGTLVSLSGEQVTLSEGTRRATYKTVTVSLPSDVVVRLSRRPSSLSALAPGDLLEILQGPRRSTVIARSPSATSSAPQG